MHLTEIMRSILFLPYCKVKWLPKTTIILLELEL